MNKANKAVVSTIYRIVGRINGEGQGYILGFTKSNSKSNAVKGLINKGKQWTYKEIELVPCNRQSNS